MKIATVGGIIGLVETYLYGWYIALVFVPLFNRFNKTADPQSLRGLTAGAAIVTPEAQS